MQNYLVFEGVEVTSRNVNNQPDGTTVRFGQAEPLVVRAQDEQGAAMAAVRITKRISQYAIVPVTVIDFAADLEASTPKPEVGRLVSGDTIEG